MTQERLPSSVDLRSAYDETYNQGPTLKCGGYAVANALDAMLENATGRPVRVSPDYTYWLARAADAQPWLDGGSSPQQLQRSLADFGYLMASEWSEAKAPLDQDIALARARGPLRLVDVMDTPGSDVLHQIKRSLALGLPVIVAIPLYDTMGEGTASGNWREHDFAVGGSFRNYHWLVAQGYDDAVQRVLAENSWGRGFGDKGYCGFTYEQILSGLLITNAWRIEHVPGVPLAPRAGYVPPEVEQVPLISGSRQWERLRAWVSGQVHTAFGSRGVEGLLEVSGDLGLEARTVEVCAGLAPGFVAAYAKANPQVDWSRLTFGAPDWITIPHALTTAEGARQVNRLLPWLRAQVTRRALQPQAVESVLDLAHELGLSDLALEASMRWPRGTVRAAFDQESGWPTARLCWEPL